MCTHTHNCTQLTCTTCRPTPCVLRPTASLSLYRLGHLTACLQLIYVFSSQLATCQSQLAILVGLTPVAHSVTVHWPAVFNTYNKLLKHLTPNPQGAILCTTLVVQTLSNRWVHSLNEGQRCGYSQITLGFVKCSRVCQFSCLTYMRNSNQALLIISCFIVIHRVHEKTVPLYTLP